MTDDTFEKGTGSGSGIYGSSGNCPAEGWAVFKWNKDHFELEDGSNCKPGFSPPAPPVPTPSERDQIDSYNEFRAIVCCVSGGSSSS